GRVMFQEFSGEWLVPRDEAEITREGFRNRIFTSCLSEPPLARPKGSRCPPGSGGLDAASRFRRNSVVAAGFILFVCAAMLSSQATKEKDFQTTFPVDKKNLGVQGSNPYF